MDVKLPNLGEGADNGTVVNLYVKAGDRIEKGQPLLELENEKAVAMIPSTVSGTVASVFVKMGDRVSVGHKIVSVNEAGGPIAAPAPAAAPKPAAQPVAHAAPAPPTNHVAAPAAEEPLPEVSAAGVAAAPSIKQMASDLGIDLTKVRGTASGGRIVLSDVRNYIQKLVAAAQSSSTRPAATSAKPVEATEVIDFSKWGPTVHKPMTSLRKVISRRMLENWNAIPHVTQFDDADVTLLQEIAKKHTAAFEKQGAKLTVTVLVIKALVDTLKKHAIFNSSLDEAAGEIIFKEYFNVGIAVDTEAGLIVPVLKDADKKSLPLIAKELAELAGKARSRKLSTDELKGGSFTISNQGGIGSGHFTPIVNKPEVAILGLGRSALKPVVRDGAVLPKLMLPLCLSYDHRVIDGGAAARFMVDLVLALEKFDEKIVTI